MAAKFEMDPQATASGLADAGVTRSQAVAAGIPSLPVGNYVAPYMTTLGALVATASADLEGLVAFGLATSAASVATAETAEGENVAQLGT